MTNPSARPAVADTRPLCRHCRKRKANRPRQLCWTCYYTPGIRRRYPPLSQLGRYAALSHGDSRDSFAARPLPTPTDAMPGSPGKLEILRERARRGEQLFHPHDAKETGGRANGNLAAALLSGLRVERQPA